MKNKLILVLSVISLLGTKVLISCSNSRIMKSDSIDFEVNISSCVYTDSLNTIKVSVKNYANQAYWLHSWGLYLFEVRNDKGRLIAPVKLFERGAPMNVDEYIIIEPAKTTEFKMDIYDFNAYNLNINENYTAEFKYKGLRTKKDQKMETLMNEKKIDTVSFKSCLE